MLQRHERPHRRPELLHPGHRDGRQQPRALLPGSWVLGASASDLKRAGEGMGVHGAGRGVVCSCGATSSGHM